MLLSAVASHDIPADIESQQTALERFYDIPIFQLMRFALLFGWLKAADDLQNPFGMEM